MSGNVSTTPIYPSAKDRVTEGTMEQIVIHNEGQL